ncbi:MAG: acylneuraminate cytidylyltransferase, partial [Campylobacterota bacterium]|nr:acylneuraminate cytidylyltransferase [Campylobacterota bacterium]
DLTKPRQQLAKAYLPNGAIYICRVDDFLQSKNIFKKPLSIFKMDKESSVDIDGKNDLNITELTLRNL